MNKNDRTLFDAEMKHAQEVSLLLSNERRNISVNEWMFAFDVYAFANEDGIIMHDIVDELRSVHGISDWDFERKPFFSFLKQTDNPSYPPESNWQIVNSPFIMRWNFEPVYNFYSEESEAKNG